MVENGFVEEFNDIHDSSIIKVELMVYACEQSENCASYIYTLCTVPQLLYCFLTSNRLREFFGVYHLKLLSRF